MTVGSGTVISAFIMQLSNIQHYYFLVAVDFFGAVVFLSAAFPVEVSPADSEWFNVSEFFTAYFFTLL